MLALLTATALAAEPIKLSFGWPESVDATLEHRVVSDSAAPGRTDHRESAATVTWQTWKEGRTTIVAFSDYRPEILTSSEQLAGATWGVLHQLTWMCDAELDRKGQVKAVFVDACLPAIHESLSQGPEGPGSAQFRTQLSDPDALMEITISSAQEFLGLYQWGRKLVPGQEIQEAIEDEPMTLLGHSVTLGGTLTSRISEPTPCPRLGQPACVEIQEVVEYDSEDLLPVVAQAFGRDHDGEVVMRIETNVLLERDTGLPHASRSRTFTRAASGGQLMFHDTTVLETRVVYKDSTPFDVTRLAPDHPFRTTPRTYLGAVQAFQTAELAAQEGRHADAVTWAGEASAILLELDPHHPEARITEAARARSLMDLERHAEAGQLAQEALTRWPAQEAPSEQDWMIRGGFLGVGVAACTLDGDDACLDTLQPEALALARQGPSPALVERMLKLHTTGRPLDQMPEDQARAAWELWSRAAAWYEETELPQDAGGACLSGLELQREAELVDPALARWCVGLAERHEAADFYQQAFHHHLGAQLDLAGEHAEAAAVYRAQAEAAPVPELAREMRLHEAYELRHLGQLAETEALLLTHAPEAGDDPRLRVLWVSRYGKLLLELDRPGEVIQLLEDLHAEPAALADPVSAHTRSDVAELLGWAYLEAGNPDEAARWLANAAEAEVDVAHPRCDKDRRFLAASIDLANGVEGAEEAREALHQTIREDLGPGHWALRLYE